MLICKKHPQYKAIKKPNSNCKICKKIYKEKNKQKTKLFFDPTILHLR